LYFLNTNINLTSKTNINPHKPKVVPKPHTSIVNGHIKQNPNIHRPLLTPKSLQKSITPLKPLITTPHLLIATNNTSQLSQSSALVRIPPPIDPQSVGENTKTSQKTWVKKMTPDLESKVIDPSNSRNKSLRHPSSLEPSEKTP